MAPFLIQFATLFLLGLWLGGGAAIAFLAAPVAFEKLPTRGAAGELVGAMLRRLDRFTLLAGVVLVVLCFLEIAAAPGAARNQTLRLALLGSMLALVCFNRFQISPEIASLRRELGPSIEAVAPEDPRRKSFGRLHGMSVACLLGQLVLGALAFGASVISIQGRVG